MEPRAEADPECVYEYKRHRFKPYSGRELAGMLADEHEMYRQMGDFAEFVQLQEELERQPCVQFDK